MKKSMMIALLFLSLIFGMSLPASTNTKLTSPFVNPRETATISFTFDGLMAICFGNPERVSIGVLNVEHHTPTITITKVTDEHRSVLAVLKAEQIKKGLSFDVEDAQPTVKRYLTSSTDPNDFRWTIDMESDLFQRELYIKEEKLVGKIHLSAGLFYAANLSEEKFLFADRTGKMLPVQRRIAEPAAKLNLNPGNVLVIKGGDTLLKLVAESGVRYEIAINNLPPDDMASMDHFLYYYDFINAKVPQYSPVLVQKATFGPRPLYCTAAIFSKSRLD